MRIGIDVGGTKIEGIALGESGETLERTRVATPHDYRGTIEAIAALVRAFEAKAGVRGTVGVGIPGAVSPDTGQVKNANSTWLIGQPFGSDLSATLGRPIRLMNDANCFALSEATDGAAAGHAVVFGVILGTGVGGGIVIDGRCLAGANLIAGEWGHNALPRIAPEEFPGPPCYCGRNGCIETWLSGPSFARDHTVNTGEALRGPEIVQAAAGGDATAQATIERYVARLARALGMVVNVVDPDIIVLGGGMSNLPSLAELVSAQLPDHVFSDTVLTRVVRHKHGDASGVRGAAWLWPAEGDTPHA